MARIADKDRPSLDGLSLDAAADVAVSDVRATSRKTVDDINPAVRAHVEHAYTNGVVRVVALSDEEVAKEVVRQAKLYATLRETPLTVGATVVKDYTVPGSKKVLPLAVTILARDKITRTRKAKSE